MFYLAVDLYARPRAAEDRGILASTYGGERYRAGAARRIHQDLPHIVERQSDPFRRAIIGATV
jgi:hypothetical protein